MSESNQTAWERAKAKLESVFTKTETDRATLVSRQADELAEFDRKAAAAKAEAEQKTRESDPVFIERQRRAQIVQDAHMRLCRRTLALRAVADEYLRKHPIPEDRINAEMGMTAGTTGPAEQLVALFRMEG